MIISIICEFALTYIALNGRAIDAYIWRHNLP